MVGVGLEFGLGLICNVIISVIILQRASSLSRDLIL